MCLVSTGPRIGQACNYTVSEKCFFLLHEMLRVGLCRLVDCESAATVTYAFATNFIDYSNALLYSNATKATTESWTLSRQASDFRCTEIRPELTSLRCLASIFGIILQPLVLKLTYFCYRVNITRTVDDPHHMSKCLFSLIYIQFSLEWIQYVETNVSGAVTFPGDRR